MNKLIYVIFCVGITMMVSCKIDKKIPPPEYTNKFYQMPEDIYGGLYRELQLYEAIPHEDFADAIPLKAPKDIWNDFRRAKNDHDFDMKTFLQKNFIIPTRATTYRLDSSRSLSESIDMLWQKWKKPVDKLPAEGSSLIPLGHPYVVENDIANDVSYWNAYYTMLGLAHREEYVLLQDMLDNFANLIDKFSFIPYSNRTYNTTRSQFPVFVDMVALLAEEKGEDIWQNYLPYVEIEYNYWMKYAGDLSDDNVDSFHVVKYQDHLLNRYWDENVTPRPEYYKSDDQDAYENEDHAKWMSFRDFRATAESGWNFSSRFMYNSRWRGSTMTTGILPIDLNSALYHYEMILSEKHLVGGNDQKSKIFKERATKRKEAILNLFWDNEKGIFRDIAYSDSTLMDRESLAMIYPLYYNIVDQDRADSIANFIDNELLKAGGVMTSTGNTRQRWDAPFGWAQLHWVTYQGLINYGQKELAQKVAFRWVSTVEKTYNQIYRFEDFYNVEDIEDNYEETSDTLNYAWTVAVYEILKDKAK
jgi:alpha,alpha-trehalase